VRVPTVIGWVRPVVLVPVSAATNLTPEQLRALLAHELAHIRRYDYLVNLALTFTLCCSKGRPRTPQQRAPSRRTTSVSMWLSLQKVSVWLNESLWQTSSWQESRS